MGDIDRRFRIPTEILVAALVLTAAIPLRRLFEPGRIGGIVVLAAGLSLITSWGTRRLRFPPLLAWFTSMMCMLWWIAVLFFPDSLWGPLPSADTFHQIGQAIRVGVREIYVEAVPVPATDAKMMLVSAGVWVTAWLAEAAALWIKNGLVSIACTVPLFVVPGALERSDKGALEIGSYVAAIGLLLAADQADRVRRLTPARSDDARASWRAGPTVRLIALVLFAVVLATPLLPGFGAPPGFAGSGSSGGSSVRFNPLVAIKPTLDNSRVRTLFLVETSRPAYYRLTSLDHFTGDQWEPGKLGSRPGPEFTPGDPQWPTRTLEQSFSMRALAGEWLPAAFNPVSVRASEPVSLETPTRALIVDGGLSFGAQYSVRSEVPAPDPELLDRNVDYDRRALERYLRLPRAVPRSIRGIARDVTRGQDTPFRQAVALQDYLRTFTYDERIAEGHSFETLEEFLTVTKAGYCEQFAGSMAVLLRTLGIPSRVSIGFARGNDLGGRLFEVTTEHAHAWVEVFFPQSGWVIFEPTPRGGIATPPRYARIPTGEDADDPQDDPASTTPTVSTSAAPREEETAGPDLVTEAAPSPLTRISLVVAGVLVALVIAALALRVVPRLRRKSTSPAGVVWGRYADLLAWCASAGVPRKPGQTPHEHATVLARAAPAAEEAAGAVATLVSEALWAPPNGLDPSAFDAAAEQVRAALRETLPARKRFLTTLGWGRWRSST